MAGAAASSRIACDSLSLTAGGVPAGANTAVQDPDCAFFTPASSMVGTSGMAGDRAAPVTASARNLPPVT
ncbi:hypothetical protein G6F50_018558 [Rhizopus delemar]|uniref:Uncharacterized protein n=1 Tax=Rhizopus delemar TaxID=936053 RepID=A0A9P7BZ01_9FUNG|nr:hypothetical protein G6F50_018558 [Rhizopus delemar]